MNLELPGDLADALLAPEQLIGELTASLAAPQTSRPPTWRWREPTPKDRMTLPCDNCGRRIAWWTVELRSGWVGLKDADHRGWKWQGGECPIRFRGEFVDAACRSCDWAKVDVARQPLPKWWTAPPELL